MTRAAGPEPAGRGGPGGGLLGGRAGPTRGWARSRDAAGAAARMPRGSAAAARRRPGARARAAEPGDEGLRLVQEALLEVEVGLGEEASMAAARRLRRRGRRSRGRFGRRRRDLLGKHVRERLRFRFRNGSGGAGQARGQNSGTRVRRRLRDAGPGSAIRRGLHFRVGSAASETSSSRAGGSQSVVGGRTRARRPVRLGDLRRDVRRGTGISSREISVEVLLPHGRRRLDGGDSGPVLGSVRAPASGSRARVAGVPRGGISPYADAGSSGASRRGGDRLQRDLAVGGCGSLGHRLRFRGSLVVERRSRSAPRPRGRRRRERRPAAASSSMISEARPRAAAALRWSRSRAPS